MSLRARPFVVGLLPALLVVTVYSLTLLRAAASRPPAELPFWDAGEGPPWSLAVGLAALGVVAGTVGVLGAGTRARVDGRSWCAAGFASILAALPAFLIVGAVQAAVGAAAFERAVADLEAAARRARVAQRVELPAWVDTGCGDVLVFEPDGRGGGPPGIYRERLLGADLVRAE